MFDLYFPTTYPSAPPSVLITTTGLPFSPSTGLGLHNFRIFALAGNLNGMLKTMHCEMPKGVS